MHNNTWGIRCSQLPADLSVKGDCLLSQGGRSKGFAGAARPVSSKGTAAKIKLASGPFLVSFFSHVSSGSSGFFAYFFMPSQIFCAFLQVCALFFLAIKSDFLWSRERHNTLSSFCTHITLSRLWHNFQRRNGENYSWSSRLSLGLWRQTYTYASSSCCFP